jgi:hypothetical protein
VTGRRLGKFCGELCVVWASSPDINRIIRSRKMRWAGHLARIGEFINACRNFVGKPEGELRFGRPNRAWAEIVRLDLVEVIWEGVG